MIELGLVFGLLVGLVGGAAILSRVPWDWLLGAGGLFVVGGILFSLPSGLVYHLRLRRTLLQQGALPPRWWLYPTRLHARIPEDRRRWVLRPFLGGAIGMGVCIVGCLFVAYGAWRSPPG